MSRVFLAISIGMVGAVSVFSEINVSDLSVSQRAGSKWMDITYDLSGTAGEEWADVALNVTSAGVSVAAISLSGDAGNGIPVRSGRAMAWDMGADWNGNYGSLSYTVSAVEGEIPVPEGMVEIPAGTNSGTNSYGNYSFTMESFYMDSTEVTKAQWDVVYSWAVTNGYSINGYGLGKASDHPVYSINWYDCVKWCNARSEMLQRTPCYTVSGATYKTGNRTPDCDFEANGIRLPTTDEWEYAARGGLTSKRFPWGDTISHDRANYSAISNEPYDESYPTEFHPVYNDGTFPYTSPAGAFAPNAYGLYDMAGNVWEWCWNVSTASAPMKGGSWYSWAYTTKCDYEQSLDFSTENSRLGFRTIFK